MPLRSYEDVAHFILFRSFFGGSVENPNYLHVFPVPCSSFGGAVELVSSERVSDPAGGRPEGFD